MPWPKRYIIVTDTMTPSQRHYCMSRIRSKDTRPELLTRRFLWSAGVRYRLHWSGLPGHPDIVIPNRRVAIFVHGCFWHGHNCRDSSPATRPEYWSAKIAANRARDARVEAQIQAQGWTVLTVWECQLTPRRRERTLSELLAAIQARPVATRTRRAPYPDPYDQDSYDDGYTLTPDIAADPDTPYGDS